MQDPSILVIGTRASPLAMAQAHETAARLQAALGWEADRFPLRPMTSTGDIIADRSLADAGGKGLFTKELDEALVSGAIDLAVHSAKDVPTTLPDGLAIVGYLPREDPRDMLVTRIAGGLAGLPAGTVVGSASARRRAIVLRARPDLDVQLIRGNVGTRLGKLDSGAFGATLLALAGLKRLGRADLPGTVLSTGEMLPAVGQGAIALVARADDERACELALRVCDAATGAAVTAERAFLAVLDGSCKTPIAGHAEQEVDGLAFRGIVLTLDGRDAREVSLEATPADAGRIGREAGLDLAGRLPAGWLAA